MLPTVQSGPLRFRNRGDLDKLRLAFVNKEPAYGLTVIGASVNGQSFQFSNAGATYTEEEFGDILADAYNQLGVYTYGTPTPNRTVARFNDGAAGSCIPNGFRC